MVNDPSTPGEAAPNSYFLTSLDKVLIGDHRLVSWRKAYAALSHLALAKRTPHLRHFLEDELTISGLSCDLTPLPAPTSQTKASFETRTAAINITPSANGEYDIQQIKDDTLWLSKLTKLDEELALRLVILEWQGRSTAKILEGYTEEEAISVQQVVGDNSFGASQLAQPGPGSQDLESTFISDANRHARLLRLYISEQEHLLGVSCILAAAALPDPRGSSKSKDKPAACEYLPWLETVLSRLSVASSGKQRASNPERRIEAAIEALERAIKAWESGAEWTAELPDGHELNPLYKTSQLRHVLLVLKLLCIHVGNVPAWASASSVQAWFSFLDKVGFFERLQALSPDQHQLVQPIQALASLISLQLLRLPDVIHHTNEAKPHGRPVPFIYDHTCREQVDSTLSNAAANGSTIAGPALFAWSIVLQEIRERVQTNDPDEDTSSNEGSPTPVRRTAAVDAPAGLASALDAILQNVPDGDPITYYAQAAISSCGVMQLCTQLPQLVEESMTIAWLKTAAVQSMTSLLDLLREALRFVDYGDEIIESILALLMEHSKDSNAKAPLVSKFLQDSEVLVPRLLQQAQARYPYESMPLYQLGQALSLPPEMRQMMAQDHGVLVEPALYFTMRLPRGFEAYETTREEENANIVRLTQDIPLFIPRRGYGYSKSASSQALVARDDEDTPLLMRIPAGTLGQVLSDDRPYLIRWNHPHYVSQYLACLLASEVPGSRHKDISNDGIVEEDTQADIIKLFSSLLKARATTDDGYEQAKEFLQEASEYLGRNGDIVSVIYDLLEERLSHRSQRSDASISIIVSSIDFLTVVLPILPGRVWPLLARGELFGLDGRSNRLSSIIGSADDISSRVRLVESCIHLSRTLLKDLIAQSTSTSFADQAVIRRFESLDDRSSGLPQRLTSKIVLSLTQLLLSVAEGTQSWPAEATASAHKLRIAITQVFDHLLVSAFTCGDSSLADDTNLCGALAPSGRLILEAFLDTSTSDILLGGLWSTFAAEALSTEDLACASNDLSHDVSIIPAFFTNLLTFSVHYDTPSLHLASKLFQALPLIVRGYAAYDGHKTVLLKLLSSMVRTTGAFQQEPPTLLGHLGSGTARAFLTDLQCLNQSLGDQTVEIATWTLAADVISNRQPWVTSFLLNGETPKRTLRNKPKAGDEPGSSRPRLRSLLSTALATLSKEHGSAALVQLHFLVQCQNYRPAITSVIRENRPFLDKILSYVSDLRTSLSKDELMQANQCLAASHISDLLAMYIHNIRQLGNVDDLDHISSNLTFYRENGVTLPDYNGSLHTNLKRNFEKKFTGCSLESFKRRQPMVSVFGRDYYYDLTLAREVLGKSPAWKGGKGFEEELARANINMSLVESQVLLMKSWESLVTELSNNLQDREGLQKQMINVVSHCLSNNNRSANHNEAVFEHLMQRRADLALVVMHRLVNVRCKASSFKTLLNPAWEMVRSSGQDFEAAFTGDNVEYYRTTLQVLLLAIQPHTYLKRDPTASANDLSLSPGSSRPASEDMPTLTEITSSVVCLGFRSLCSQLHSSPSTVDPTDLGLLIALLQTIIRVPHISTIYNTLSLRIGDTGVHRYALALFSWSDRLLTTKSPIKTENNTMHALTIADLSISFLHTLSSIPPFAEFLGTESVLSQLASSPLLSHLRAEVDGKSSTITSELLRLHLIWSRPILSLILNLLTAIGPSFAPEAAAFLSSFPAQLTRASNSLSPSTKLADRRQDLLAGTITLATAREVHTLALLSLAITQAQDSPVGYSGMIGEGLSGVSNGAWDPGRVREDVEGWLGSRRAELRARIRPSSEWEEGLIGQSCAREDECENRLELAVVTELRGAASALGGSE